MQNGTHFLVSCPIDLFSAVTVELTEDGQIVAPADTPKAEAALRAAMRFFGVETLGARLSIASPLPRSKGMGSSTADVAGAIYALAVALGRPISPMDVGRLAVGVEPTNSSLFPNLALFDHRQGTLCQELGPAPAADILVLDCGGYVDTVAYNTVDRSPTLRRLEPLVAQALAMVREGILKGDLHTVAQGATISARAHQEVLPKPPLEAVIGLGSELGAAGVSVAHSGTVIGVLFPVGEMDRADLASRMRAQVPGISVIGWTRLIGGGCYALLKSTQVDVAAKFTRSGS